MRLGRRHVDMVVADPEVGEQLAADIPRRLEHLARERVAQRRQHRIETRESRQHLIPVERFGRLPQGHVVGRAQLVQHGVRQGAGDEDLHQKSRPPLGTDLSGVMSTTSPSASGTPRTRISDMNLPI